jgi:hypothetical protein
VTQTPGHGDGGNRSASQRRAATQAERVGSQLGARAVLDRRSTGAREGRQYSCRTSGGVSVVLVDEAAEAVVSAVARHVAREELEDPVRPLRVVVVD